jgi:hypothetical protein
MMPDAWQEAFYAATEARCRLAHRVGWLEGSIKRAIAHLREGRDPDVAADFLEIMMKEKHDA